jgi:thiamine kinase-like enzyme
MVMQQVNFSDEINDVTREKTIKLIRNWALNSDSSVVNVNELSGGLNNTNLMVRSDENITVLKIRPNGYGHFGADAQASAIAQSHCALLGIEATVIATDEDEGHSLSSYIYDESLRPDTIRINNLLNPIVNVLKVVHGAQLELKQRTFFDDIRLFMIGANRSQVFIPEGFKPLLAKAYELEKKLSVVKAPTGLCQNDLVSQNFIHSEDRLYLVDFDFAGTCWISADLTSAASQFELTETETETFLNFYDERLDDSQRA